jgi:hypothetical protein
VIRLDQRKPAFGDIINRLNADETKSTQSVSYPNKPSSDFFSGNISSLLDTFAQIKTLEIRREFSAKFLSEEIELIFK